MFAGSVRRHSQEHVASLVLGERTQEQSAANQCWPLPAALRLAPLAGDPAIGLAQ